MQGDRERWNDKWRARAGELESPAAFVVEQGPLLPDAGRALDVAGGCGRHAVWLAQHGLDVTLIDVSDLALERAGRRFAQAGVRVRMLRADLDDDVPSLPLFDAIVMVHYLNRQRRDEIAHLLAPGGVVIAAQPTVANLERHASPSRRFLVETGELELWARGLNLEIVVAREGWTADGRHEAELVARRVKNA
jgi:SAM-dependent methyltransferase